MLQHLMYPKPGWIAVHVIAVVALFLLGYSVRF
jgi:hypothetical protein